MSRKLVTEAQHVLVAIVDQARVVLPIARRLGRPTWTDLHATTGDASGTAISRRPTACSSAANVSATRDRTCAAFVGRAASSSSARAEPTERFALTADERWLEIPAEPVETSSTRTARATPFSPAACSAS